MVEIFQESEVDLLDAFMQAGKTIETLTKLKARGNGKPLTMDYTIRGETEEKSVALDDEFLHIINGGRSGLYESLRRKGLQPTANNIMLQEGIVQPLKGVQRKFLKTFDKQYKI